MHCRCRCGHWQPGRLVAIQVSPRDAGPLRRGWGQAGEGEVAIDPEYRRLSRERHQAAATKTRLMRVIDDPRAGTIARAAPPVKIQIGKRKARCRAGHHALSLYRVTCNLSLLTA